MEIENVAKPRRQRRSKKDKRNAAEALINALKFVSPVQKRSGSIEQQYCFIGNNWLVAASEGVTIATPIQEDLNACPHTYLFLDALSKCGLNFSITQLDSFRVAVNSDSFIAVIDCVPSDNLKLGSPDNIVGLMDNRIVSMFEIANKIIDDGYESTYAKCAYLWGNSLAITNGTILIEFYTGLGLQENYLIPKLFIESVIKSKKDLATFGSNKGSLTFYFSDNSLVKGELYEEDYPNYSEQFNLEQEPNYWTLPDDFFIGLKAIQPFCPNGTVYINKDGFSNGADKDSETTYGIKGVFENMAFSIENLLLLEKISDLKVQFVKETQKLYFTSNALHCICRGVLIGRINETAEIGDTNVPI